MFTIAKLKARNIFCGNIFGFFVTLEIVEKHPLPSIRLLRAKDERNEHFFDEESSRINKEIPFDFLTFHEQYFDESAF